MQYLRTLAAIRAVTGTRTADAFPPRPAPIEVFRDAETSRGTAFVHDAALARAVLESRRYRQFDFVARILNAADPDRTSWIRRFCDVSLIMIDGVEHQRRRQAMDESIERCIDRLRRAPAERWADVVTRSLDTSSPPPASHRITLDLVAALFSESIAALAGRDVVAIEGDGLADIDFFNPFPTLSTLYRCDAALGRCAARIDLEHLDIDAQAAILSLLVMGITPIQAILTAAINAAVTKFHAGEPCDDALAALKTIDAYTVVPTNFVMRECVVDDELGGEAIVHGDIVYVFLGTASGCPFSRQTALPFGAGVHVCSGAKLTSVMLATARGALADAGEGLRRVAPAEVIGGRAHAFLLFRDGDGTAA